MNYNLKMNKIFIKTNQKEEAIEISERINEVIAKEKIKEGIAYIFLPHTTCGLLLNENYDPTVIQDIFNSFEELIPSDKNYLHQEGNAPSHIKTAFLTNSLTLLIKDYQILLGKWQGLFLIEFDGPRTRNLIIKILPT